MSETRLLNIAKRWRKARAAYFEAVEQREGVEVEISGEALVGGVQRGLSITFTGTRQETAELSGRLVEELARVGVTPAIDAPEAAP